MVSDIVLLKPLPDVVLHSVEAYAACISGAMLKEEYLAAISSAGFEEIEVVSQAGGENIVEVEVRTAERDAGDTGSQRKPGIGEFAEFAGMSVEEFTENVAKSAVSIKVRAKKPNGAD